MPVQRRKSKTSEPVPRPVDQDTQNAIDGLSGDIRRLSSSLSNMTAEINDFKGEINNKINAFQTQMDDMNAKIQRAFNVMNGVSP